MRFGLHISIAGGLKKVIPRAVALGCEAIQVFTSSQLRWKRSKLDEDDVESFRFQFEEAKLHPLVVHMFYLPNLATPDRTMLDRSRDALLIELERSAILGADYLVLHPGAHKESSLEEGIKKISASINYVIAKVEGNAKNKVKILIENTAGGGTRIGAEFSELAGIFDRLKQTYRVGICLDTAHAFQAGYPIHRPDGLEKTLREFERLVGLEKINLLHLNDSKTRFSSRNDRHWHIGKGEMGIDAFDRIINHPDLAHLPAILETPSSEEDDLRNMTTVKQLRKNSDRS